MARSIITLSFRPVFLVVAAMNRADSN